MKICFLDFLGNIQFFLSGDELKEIEGYTGSGKKKLFLVEKYDGTLIRITENVFNELEEVFRMALAEKLVK